MTVLTGAVALGQQVRTSYLPGIDFSSYHSYKWAAIKGGQHPNPGVDAQIMRSVDSLLSTKGFTRKDNNPDLYIAYQVAVSEDTKWVKYEEPGGRWAERSEISPTVERIVVGSLVLDIYDSTGKHVWMGRAAKVIDPSSGDEQKQRNLDRAVHRLLSSFPPK